MIRVTENQRDRLQGRFVTASSDTRVYFAMQHSSPFVADVLAEAVSDGVEELLTIPLTSHYSKMSTGSYILAVEMGNDALPGRKLKLDFTYSWYTQPQLLEAWASRIRKEEKKLPKDYSLIFSAHSLPERILAQGDTYRDQLIEMSGLIAARVPREDWSFAFQSAGHTGEPWMGPEILKHLQALFEKGGRSFLIAPIGFVSDNLEILYDLDIECMGWANEHGVKLSRCELLNDSSEFIDCLYSVAAQKGFL